MHDIRESSFEVEFESPSSRRVARVRAWDATEAAELFEAELRADGVDEEGEVVVSPVHGGGGARARLPRHRAA